MTEDDNIEKLFRDSFGDFEVQPPAGVKKQIDKRLKGRSGRFIFWILGAALLVVLSILGFNAYFSTSPAGAQSGAQPSVSSGEAAIQSNTYSGNEHRHNFSSSVDNSISPASTPLSTGDPGIQSKFPESSSASSTLQKTGTTGNPVATNKAVQSNQSDAATFSSANSIDTKLRSMKPKHANPATVSPKMKKFQSEKTVRQANQGKTKAAPNPSAANTGTKDRPAKTKRTNPASATNNPSSKPKQTNAGEHDAAQSARTASPSTKNTENPVAASPSKGNAGARNSEKPSTNAEPGAKTTEITKQEIDSAASVKASSTSASPGKSGVVTETPAVPASNNAPEKQSETKTANKTDVKDPKDPNQSKKWLAQLQPGIGFSSASKAAQDVKGVAGFGITGAVYRQFGNKIPIRAGLDVSFNSGNFNWSKDSTTITTITLDSLVPNQQDSVTYYDTVYYTVNQPHTQTTDYRSSFSQISFGLSAQFDAPLSEKTGFVLTPGFRFAQTKFVRQSDGATFKSGRTQLNLGLDFYYDWKYWRFTLGAGYTHTWMKTADNPFTATGVSQFVPRIGIGIRF